MREIVADCSIPVEDLASNGESMRGKVFHIACALCAQVGGGVDERGQELIKDWCNMVSLRGAGDREFKSWRRQKRRL